MDIPRLSEHNSIPGFRTTISLLPTAGVHSIHFALDSHMKMACCHVTTTTAEEEAPQRDEELSRVQAEKGSVYL